MMNMEFSIISGKVVRSLIDADIRGCVERVKEAYLAHENGETVNPDSYFMLFPDRPRDRIIALPASLGGSVDVSGIKWIASYPENIRLNIPRASAVLVLNSRTTGYPFACLEGSIISAARTAGSAVLAAEWMNDGKRAIRRLGIIGNGLIARYIYTFLIALGWQVDEVVLYDIDPAEAERFATSVCRAGDHRRVASAPDIESAIRESDVILLATVASTPHIRSVDLLSHNPLVLNISLRDLSPEIILAAHNVVDDVAHVMKANTSPHLAERMSGSRAFVTGTIAELMRGKCRLDRKKPRVFSPFGLGVLDLAVGKWVYDVAREQGRTIPVTDFFYEMTR
jgi:N-[(2S)-2-amino-2-carboxyethyl]-L-glutamate dehydrogenase